MVSTKFFVNKHQMNKQSQWLFATAVIEVGRLILDMSTKRWRETMNRKLEVILKEVRKVEFARPGKRSPE